MSLRRLPRRKRFSGLSFNRMLPNLMTLLGLCIGLSSIRLAMDGNFGNAVIAIAVSGVIDGLDGRLARLLKATSRFGAEFDSLADFLCFGIAPGLVIYLWSLQAWGAMGFLPPLMYTSAMALRLARFNAALDSTMAAGPISWGMSSPSPIARMPRQWRRPAVSPPSSASRARPATSSTRARMASGIPSWPAALTARRRMSPANYAASPVAGAFSASARRVSACAARLL